MVSSSTPATSNWSLVFSRGRMLVFGFVFGFLFRGPFLGANEMMISSTSSSRMMQSMEESSTIPTNNEPVLRGTTKQQQAQSEVSKGASKEEASPEQAATQVVLDAVEKSSQQLLDAVEKKTLKAVDELEKSAQVLVEAMEQKAKTVVDAVEKTLVQQAGTTAIPTSQISATTSKPNKSEHAVEHHAVAPQHSHTELVNGEVGNATVEIRDFEKQEKVVIAIKIHGIPYLTQLKQSLCLLTVAYNGRMQYDVLLFHSEPLPEEDIAEIESIVHPAKFIREQDELTLEQHIEKLNEEEISRLLKRCNVANTSQLEWWTRCEEEGYNGAAMPLRYNWQAEFRSKWIWYSKALSNYRWMLWIDSDAMMTKVWKQDPIAFAIRNKLKIFFANFPQGSTKSPKLKEKIMKSYNNETLCGIKLVDGHLHPIHGDCENPKIPQIHGFFHITDLDFYRNEENLGWFNNMIGDSKFSRQWDDQLAVTVPAAMRAANESWSMNHHGVQLDVYHNSFFDGRRRWRGGGYNKWYQNRSAIDFPESIDKCKPLVKNAG